MSTKDSALSNREVEQKAVRLGKGLGLTPEQSHDMVHRMMSSTYKRIVKDIRRDYPEDFLILLEQPKEIVEREFSDLVELGLDVVELQTWATRVNRELNSRNEYNRRKRKEERNLIRAFKDANIF